MNIIALDVDCVTADLMTPWLARYNYAYDDNLTENKITSWDLHKFVKKECGHRIYKYLDDPQLYNDVKPIPGALEAVQTIREVGDRVIFVTASPQRTQGRKLQWLVDNGFLPSGHKGLGDYVEAHDKGLILADLLLDDAAHNVRAFRGGTAVLFDKPWNRETNWPYRALGWPFFLNYCRYLWIYKGKSI